MSKRKGCTSKVALADRVYKRLDRQIESDTVRDSITYITAWIMEQILSEHQATIKNFATFSIKKVTRKGLKKEAYSFYWPRVYIQPILRKIIKYSLKTKKEMQETV